MEVIEHHVPIDGDVCQADVIVPDAAQAGENLGEGRDDQVFSVTVNEERGERREKKNTNLFDMLIR